MKNYKIYQIHNFLRVSSQLDGFIPEYFKKKEQSNKFDIKISILENIGPPMKKSFQIAPNSYYNKQRNSVIFFLVKFGFKFFLELRNLFGNTTEINLNKNYLRLNKKLVKIPLSGIFPLEHFIKMIIQIKLLQKGKSFLIGAGATKKGKNLLLFSYGGMGKTSTCLNLVKNHNFNFFSDDTIIIDSRHAYNYPTKMRIRDKTPKILSNEKYLEPVGLINKDKTKQLFDEGYILLRGNQNKIEKIENKIFSKQVSIINHKLLPFLSDTLINNSFFVNNIDLGEYISNQDKIVSSFLKRSDCYKVFSFNKRYDYIISENNKNE